METGKKSDKNSQENPLINCKRPEISPLFIFCSRTIFGEFALGKTLISGGLLIMGILHFKMTWCHNWMGFSGKNGSITDRTT